MYLNFGPSAKKEQDGRPMRRLERLIERTKAASLATRVEVEGLLKEARRVACDSGTILGCLEIVWSRKGSLGPGGVSPAMGVAERGRLARRIGRLMEQRSIVIGPTKRVSIPKSNGGTRELRLGAVQDRAAQLAVLKSLTPFCERIFLPNSLGFRPRSNPVGVAIKTALNLIEQGRWFLATCDIRDAFGSVNRELLWEILKQVLGVWWAEMIERLLGPGPGIPQGNPLSPLALNLLLHRELDSQWNNRRVALLRYADDLLLLGEDPSETKAAAEQLQRLLNEVHLTLKQPAEVEDARFRASEWLGLQLEAPDQQPGARLGPKSFAKLQLVLEDAWGSGKAERQAKAILRGWIQAFASSTQNLNQETLTGILGCLKESGWGDVFDRELIRRSWTDAVSSARALKGISSHCLSGGSAEPFSPTENFGRHGQAVSGRSQVWIAIDPAGREESRSVGSFLFESHDDTRLVELASSDYTVLRSHLRALVEAVKLAPVGVPVHVMSACRDLGQVVQRCLPVWQSRDWANVQGDPVRNRDLLEQISRLLRRRPIEFEQVDREEIDARIDAVKIQQARPIPVPDLRRPSDPPRPTMRSAAPLLPKSRRPRPPLIDHPVAKLHARFLAEPTASFAARDGRIVAATRTRAELTFHSDEVAYFGDCQIPKEQHAAVARNCKALALPVVGFDLYRERSLVAPAADRKLSGVAAFVAEHATGQLIVKPSQVSRTAVRISKTFPGARLLVVVDSKRESSEMQSRLEAQGVGGGQLLHNMRVGGPGVYVCTFANFRAMRDREIDIVVVTKPEMLVRQHAMNNWRYFPQARVYAFRTEQKLPADDERTLEFLLGPGRWPVTPATTPSALQLETVSAPRLRIKRNAKPGEVMPLLWRSAERAAFIQGVTKMIAGEFVVVAGGEQHARALGEHMPHCGSEGDPTTRGRIFPAEALRHRPLEFVEAIIDASGESRPPVLNDAPRARVIDVGDFGHPLLARNREQRRRAWRRICKAAACD